MRPVAVAVRVQRPGKPDRIVLLPITSQHPGSGDEPREIPEPEKRRVGLDVAMRLWIVLNEYNDDAVNASYYLTPQSPMGRFSLNFFLPILRDFIKRSKLARVVSRYP